MYKVTSVFRDKTDGQVRPLGSAFECKDAERIKSLVAQGFIAEMTEEETKAAEKEKAEAEAKAKAKAEARAKSVAEKKDAAGNK